MPSTRSRVGQILPLDPKLNRTLHIMTNQNNLAYIDNEINSQLPPPIDSHNRVVVDNLGEGNPRWQPPVLALKSIIDSDGPLVLPPLQHGHTFLVTSSLMQMLTTRGLFFGSTI